MLGGCRGILADRTFKHLITTTIGADGIASISIQRQGRNVFSINQTARYQPRTRHFRKGWKRQFLCVRAAVGLEYDGCGGRCLGREVDRYQSPDRGCRALPAGNGLDRHINGRSFELLTIDAEGYDIQILRSNNFTRYAPRIILIEVHLDSFASIESSDVFVFLKSAGYPLYSWINPTLMFVRNDSLLVPD